VNEKQFEALIQRQRLVIIFAKSMYDEAHEENLRLHQTIGILQARLKEAGLDSEVPPVPQEQPLLPFSIESLLEKETQKTTSNN
jgi:hypothetical protein